MILFFVVIANPFAVPIMFEFFKRLFETVEILTGTIGPSIFYISGDSGIYRIIHFGDFWYPFPHICHPPSLLLRCWWCKLPVQWNSSPSLQRPKHCHLWRVLLLVPVVLLILNTTGERHIILHFCVLFFTSFYLGNRCFRRITFEILLIEPLLIGSQWKQ